MMCAEYKKYKFVIVAQNWDSKSNGVKILYNISSLIKKSGYECFIYIWNSPDANQIPKEYKARITTKIDYTDNSIIVILPDALPYEISKQIKSKNRVWYLLNKPMVLTKEPIHIEANDLFVSYSKLVNEYDHQAFYNSKIEGIDDIIERINRGQITKKNQIAVYSGKARKVSHLKLYIFSLILGAKIIPITRSIPENKQTLLKVLAESKLLITFDPLTNLIYESTVCNTPVYIADNYVGVEYENYNIPLSGVTTKTSCIFNFFRKGISSNVYKKILDVYYQSTENHLLLTESLIKYIIDNINSDPFSNGTKALNKKRSSAFRQDYENLLKKNYLINHSLTNYAPLIDLKILVKLLQLRCFKFCINVLLLLLQIDNGFSNEIRSKLYARRCNVIAKYIQELY